VTSGTAGDGRDLSGINAGRPPRRQVAPRQLYITYIIGGCSEVVAGWGHVIDDAPTESTEILCSPRFSVFSAHEPGVSGCVPGCVS
jgi:hypothetical protein